MKGRGRVGEGKEGMQAGERNKTGKEEESVQGRKGEQAREERKSEKEGKKNQRRK